MSDSPAAGFSAALQVWKGEPINRLGEERVVSGLELITRLS